MGGMLAARTKKRCTPDRLSLPQWYMRQRWYDSSLGRFISRDPIGLKGGANRYVYAASNPVKNIDPSGLMKIQFQCGSKLKEQVALCEWFKLLERMLKIKLNVSCRDKRFTDVLGTDGTIDLGINDFTAGGDDYLDGLAKALFDGPTSITLEYNSRGTTGELSNKHLTDGVRETTHYFDPYDYSGGRGNLSDDLLGANFVHGLREAVNGQMPGGTYDSSHRDASTEENNYLEHIGSGLRRTGQGNNTVHYNHGILDIMDGWHFGGTMPSARYNF